MGCYAQARAPALDFQGNGTIPVDALKLLIVELHSTGLRMVSVDWCYSACAFSALASVAYAVSVSVVTDIAYGRAKAKAVAKAGAGG